MTGTVYGLTTALDGMTIRYVGFTTQPLSKRLKGHRHTAKTHMWRVLEWFKSREDAGHKIIMVTLKRDAVLADEAKFITMFRTEGADLLNETDGEMGSRGRIVTSTMQAAFSLPSTETQKAAVRAFNATRNYTTVSEKMQSIYSDPVAKKEIVERLQAAKAARTPEQKAETKERTRVYWADPANRVLHSKKLLAARAAKKLKQG